ncbi:hypothetical protein BC332_00208 [Capsicum chinense]|nr:hypothetical protein BC332_00208 [Capsicum chinense]
MNTGRRNLSKEMIQMLIALPSKRWSKPSALIVTLESCFGKYLDLSEDNNARFQIKMVCHLLKRRFVYENKDKMDEVWINYCGMPVYFGWKESAIVTGLKCYAPSPSQVIPTLTQEKAPRTPKKEKGKSSDRDDLAWAFEAIPYLRQQVNYQEEVSCLRILRWLSAKTDKNIKFLDIFNSTKEAIVHPWLIPTNRELKMPFFLTLRSVQTLSDPKIVDGIKMELFRAATITRKIILEGGANDVPLTVFETTSHYVVIIMVKHDGVINAINALIASVKKMTSKRGVIPSKRISYPNTPLEIKAAKRKRKDTSKASSIIKKKKIAMPLSLSCTDVQCARATEEQHELKKIIHLMQHKNHLLQQMENLLYISTILAFPVDVIATAEEHNMRVDNPSTASKDEKKVKPISLGEQKNYPFEGFNISNEAPKKLIQLIKDYSEWIFDELLKHHAGRYCQQQPKVSQNEECLINTIKGFSIPASLPWHLLDEVYILINCGDEFHWVLAVIILKERRIRVYDSMSRRRHSGPSSEIQKLAKILPTYLDMSGFLDQKVRTDWSTIEVYQDKMANPFDVQYVDGIAQQTIGSLDCGPFVAAYAEYLIDGLQVPNDGLDAGLLHKRYAVFL